MRDVGIDRMIGQPLACRIDKPAMLIKTMEPPAAMQLQSACVTSFNVGMMATFRVRRRADRHARP